MMTIKGKHNKAKVFTDIIEQGAIDQIQALCNFEPFKDCKIRIMPDVHMGAGCTIGTTMTITNKVIPNMVGVDIGCGMEVAQIEEKELSFPELDKAILQNIPTGNNVRKTPHPFAEKINLTELRCFKHIDHKRALLSIGTLGGGNHFIEVDKDDDGNLYVVIHPGSRHLGLEVAEYYQKLAYKRIVEKTSQESNTLIEKMKKEGHAKFIEKRLKKLKKQECKIPKELAYVEGKDFEDYIHDMKIVQHFAEINRQAMMAEIEKIMKINIKNTFTTVHNYIDIDYNILRKGAVSARLGERLLIPINMRDGALICIGLGNKDWNQSAPHGAGRLMSRTKALQTLSMDTYEDQMKGIYSTSICRGTLDESPDAYKSVDTLIANIADTVDIERRIYPVYNLKAAN